MELKPGTRLRSAVCAGEFVVVRAPAGEVDLRCGGEPLLPHGAPASAGTAPEGARLGKRYADAGGLVEVLCTKGGAGALTLGGATMAIKEATPLPSSD